MTRSASSKTPRRVAVHPVTGTLDQTIYDAVFDGVLSGRLRPGERLGELALAEQFGVSRTVVRQALRRLSEAQVVEIIPNKGATIAAPSPEETREVFAARRVIEAAIVRLVASRITLGEVQRLQTRLQAEHEALHQQDHGRWVMLAGGMHLALAQMAGNRVLQRMLTELMTRCSLIVALYERPGEAHCEHGEHERLVELLALGDADAAAAEMERHLQALEARLTLPT